jgi:hypothetical protein
MADLIDRISRTASSVGERGKTWLETTRLRNELEQVQQQRDEVVRGLGERVYQQMRTGTVSPSELMPAFTQIQELDQKASVLQQQIAALEAPALDQRTCSSCGNPNAPGDQFCVACGDRLEAQPKAQPRCRACGAEQKAQARFCVSCGTPAA